ncbi:MAG: glycerol-3-phosphate acyltransferase, partial [Chlamydiae bacterium]|nr:glycerol-3-phosphate acyltransferase [Chlamydiota bacterium]
TVQIELGEDRLAKRGGIHLGFGSKIDMEVFPGSSETDKYIRRKNRADYIWNLAKELYEKFPK